jgi:hypothetical protein
MGPFAHLGLPTFPDSVVVAALPERRKKMNK